MNKPEIIIATQNQGKLTEIRSICADVQVVFSSLNDVFPEKPDIPETGATFEENAVIKASWVFERKNCWIIADDSGLEVDALGGEPGVRSARYAGEKSTDATIIDKVLKNLRNVPQEKRTARFRCVIALRGPDFPITTVMGTCEGRIGFKPAGSRGFGYDPVFIPEGFTRTFAQLSTEEKNTVSHRAQALFKMKDVLYGLFGR